MGVEDGEGGVKTSSSACASSSALAPSFFPAVSARWAAWIASFSRRISSTCQAAPAHETGACRYPVSPPTPHTRGKNGRWVLALRHVYT